jgi:ankyrin repeat protein
LWDQFFEALHNAATNGMRHMAIILLKRGAAVDAPSGRGAPLQLSACVGSVKCAEALLAAGANPNARCETAPQSALDIAAFKSYGEAIKLLLEYGAGVNLAGGFGHTPLIQAAKKGILTFEKIC